MQHGVVIVDLYGDDGELLREIEMLAGDVVVLIHGVHGIRGLENMQCISVKQSPYLGEARDKVFVDSDES